MLAYLVCVGAKPIPYMFAGAVAGLLFEHLEAFPEGGVALGLTALVSSGVALVVLPPLLRLKRWADCRAKDEIAFWPLAYVTGLRCCSCGLSSGCGCYQRPPSPCKGKSDRLESFLSWASL